jgi:hypothetical protein
MVPLLLQLVEQNRSLRALTVQVRLAHHADDGRSVLKALQHRLREIRPDVQIECRVYR